jgi:thiol-disulfide isomerase/thioredoxin
LRPSWKQIRGLLFNLLLIVVVFAAASAFQMRNMLPTSGVPAPELRGLLLDGGNFDIAARGERPLLVYFFAPWCTFCAVSSDNLTRLRRLRDKDALDIVVVALDWQNVAEVREYVAKHEIELPVVLGNRRIAADWRVSAFPTYYVINSGGEIQRRDVGYSTQFGLWWRSWLVD